MPRAKFNLQHGIAKLSLRLMERHPYNARGIHRAGIQQDNFNKQKIMMRKYILMNVSHEVMGTENRKRLLELSKTVFDQNERRPFTEKELKLIHAIGKEKIQNMMDALEEYVKHYEKITHINDHTPVWAFAEAYGFIQHILRAFDYPPQRRPLK